MLVLFTKHFQFKIKTVNKTTILKDNNKPSKLLNLPVFTSLPIICLSDLKK